MSNLALAYSKKGFIRDAIEIDLKIIQIDPNFDKSYARLVSLYTQIDNLNTAQIYVDKLRSLFKPDTVAKYDNILQNFDLSLKKAEEKVKYY